MISTIQIPNKIQMIIYKALIKDGGFKVIENFGNSILIEDKKTKEKFKIDINNGWGILELAMKVKI